MNDKNLFEANIRLQDDNKMLVRDIKTLIKYMNTKDEDEKENLEDKVNDIVSYYNNRRK